MPNFSFLAAKTEYALFAPACVEAEKIFASAPALCGIQFAGKRTERSITDLLCVRAGRMPSKVAGLVMME